MTNDRVIEIAEELLRYYYDEHLVIRLATELLNGVANE